MRADTGSLYDAHADRLYAYCWSLVGDQVAAAALGDAFTAAVHRPPRGDGVLWLYSLARTVCADRGAFAPPRGALFADPDPLLRAAALLPSDHREALLLQAGEWLDVPDIARLLGVAPDTAAQLVATARARLERAVLDLLMRGTTEPRLDLISAFEKGKLPRLLAQRAPAHAPGWLRDRVIAACEDEAARDVPTVTAPIPLVVVGRDAPAEARRNRRGLGGAWSRGLGAAAGVAASAAAVIGLLASWPSARGSGSSSTIVPSSGEGRTQPASVSPNGTAGHDPAAADAGPGGVTSPYGESRRPAGTGAPAGGSSGGSAGGSAGGSSGGSSGTPAGGDAERRTSAPVSKPAPEKSPAGGRAEEGTPSPSDPPSTPPADGTPTPPPETTPPDGTTPPATPPDTGTPPPTATPTPSGTPSPTSNPAPNPG